MSKKAPVPGRRVGRYDRRKATNRGMVARSWFALLRKPDGLPCLFSSKSDAEENRDYDEYVVPVLVRPANLLDLARGERAVQASQAKAPRSSVKVRGFGLLRSALKKSEKKFRKTVSEVIAKETRSAFKGKKKRGGRRAAAPRARR